MGLLDFQVILDNPMNVYFAGQQVTGRVLINLSDYKNNTAVKITLYGQGEVHWTEREHRGTGEDRREETIHFRSSERYMEQEIAVHHGPSLFAGSHVFPFSFMTQTGLPSSFEGEHGHVRYWVEATIVRSWKFNHRTKTHFTINSILDLNQSPSAKDAGHNSDHKNLCCLCCKSGPISATVSTNRTGFVPGEVLHFFAEVDNKSNREMKGSFVNLVEMVTYKATRKTKNTRRVVAELRRGRIGPGEEDTWDNVLMHIPPVPPTNLGGSSNIISLQYSLEFHVEPTGVAFDLVVRLPITIGTIPITDYFSHYTPAQAPIYHFNGSGYPSNGQAYVPQEGLYPPPEGAYPPGEGGYPSGGGACPPGGGGFPPAGGAYPPGGEGLPYPPVGGDNPPAYSPPANGSYPPPQSEFAPNAPPPPPEAFTAYPNLPPPTYGESVWGLSNMKREDDDEHTKGNWEFIPKYVVYNPK